MPINNLSERRRAVRPGRRLEALTKAKEHLEASESKAAAALSRGAQAGAIMSNPVLVEFFEAWDETAFKLFREADPGDTDALTAARYMDVVMQVFFDSMKNLQTTGKGAALNIDDIRRKLAAVNAQRNPMMRDAEEI
jgi:hypothetical protein